MPGVRFDDELPQALPMPKPRGWYEVFCCGGLVLGLFVFLVLLALLSR